MEMNEKFATQIIERLARIEVKMDDFKSVKEKQGEHEKKITQLEEKMQAQALEIKEIKDNQKDLLDKENSTNDELVKLTTTIDGLVKVVNKVVAVLLGMAGLIVVGVIAATILNATGIQI